MRAAMAKHAVSPHQLRIQALFIVYKLAHHQRAVPYERSWTLRFLLAFLYAQTPGDDRSPFDEFWKAATRARDPAEPEERAAAARGAEMKRLANALCRAVGEEPKAIQDRFWDELTREAYARQGKAVRILR
jgi:hypothetical protein